MSTPAARAFIREAETRTFNYSEEFRLKVSIDYRKFLFLSPKQHVIIESILEQAYLHRGFLAYRLVEKENTIIHMYIEYQNALCAEDAAKTFNADYLNVASVATMLEAMYEAEYSNRQFPVWTPTLVDTVGPVHYSDPLAREVVCGMLRRMGEPRVFDFRTNGKRIITVQALFSSMAEALGASIVYGRWIYRDNSVDGFFYRVRIVGGEKENFLLKRLRIPNPETVFQMDYFLQSDSHSTPTHPTPKNNGPPHNDVGQKAEIQRPGQRTGANNQKGRKTYVRRQYSNKSWRPLRGQGQEEYRTPDSGK